MNKEKEPVNSYKFLNLILLVCIGVLLIAFIVFPLRDNITSDCVDSVVDYDLYDCISFYASVYDYPDDQEEKDDIELFCIASLYELEEDDFI